MIQNVPACVSVREREEEEKIPLLVYIALLTSLLSLIPNLTFKGLKTVCHKKLYNLRSTKVVEN